MRDNKVFPTTHSYSFNRGITNNRIGGLQQSKIRSEISAARAQKGQRLSQKRLEKLNIYPGIL